MQTVKDFGPMLTNINELQKFIKANSQKYSDLAEVIEKYGIRSNEFLNAWMKYDVDGKRQEMIKDIIGYSWDKKYQPIFDANEKFGYPKVTKETLNEAMDAEKFGYVASIISCMGQSSRQTVDIYKEADQRARKQLGDKATLGDRIDISYDIRYERWGLKKRYFGIDGQSGEKHLNKKIRDELAQLENNKSGVRTISFDAARINAERDTVIKTDAIRVPGVDSVKVMAKYSDSKDTGEIKSDNNDKTFLEDILTRNDEYPLPKIDTENSDLLMPGLNVIYESYEQLAEERVKLAEELGVLYKDAENLSKFEFSIMGKKQDVYCQTLIDNPETMGHLFESGLNPIIKDSKSIHTTKAMGLYQFNMDNTMKSLADALSNDFPLLKQAKDKYGVRSPGYEKAWIYYSTGPQCEEFKERQLVFMFNEAVGSSYKENFDWMTKHCGAPVVTLDNYNDESICVYSGAMMSATNQNPYWAKFFAKRAYERVKKYSKDGQIDWNKVGVILNDIKAERWGKKSKALYRRYIGTKKYIGEKQVCEKMVDYINEMPKLQAQIKEKENRLRYLDYALNTVKQNQWGDMALNNASVKADNAEKAQSIQASKDKFMKIKVHARNMKEWHKAKQMAKKNSNIEILEGQNYALRRSNTNTNINNNGGNHRA